MVTREWIPSETMPESRMYLMRNPPHPETSHSVDGVVMRDSFEGWTAVTRLEFLRITPQVHFDDIEDAKAYLLARVVLEDEP